MFKLYKLKFYKLLCFMLSLYGLYSLHCLLYEANSYRKDTLLKILTKTLLWSMVLAKSNTSPEKNPSYVSLQTK